jgi:hypothetical protein
MENNALLHELVSSMLDGHSIDWTTAESNADESIRRVVGELKVIAKIADVHAGTGPPDAIGVESGPQTPQTWSVLRLLEKVGEGAAARSPQCIERDCSIVTSRRTT